MQVIYERCCGLDIHLKTVVGCRLLTQQKGSVEKSIRTFATTTSGLTELEHWLAEGQVEQVALESTGIYTPPPMLQIGGGPIKRRGRRDWTDAEDHADLLFIDLHPFDQRTDNVPTGLKVRIVEPIFDFGNKGFQAAQNGPQFLFPCCFFFEALELLLKVLETLTHTCHSRFKFLALPPIK